MGLQSIFRTFWQRTCLHFVPSETLSETSFASNGLIHLAEEISRQLSIQTVAWLLLAALSQAYSENPVQKAEQKVWPEKGRFKIADQEDVVVK
jgi:predicted alpha-1,6-mannanase (GH76 family)